jgi:hypothetical protein
MKFFYLLLRGIMNTFNQHKIIISTDHGSWVRTGVDGDGNCFFHSYVYSLEPNKFRSLSYPDRLRHVMAVKLYFSTHIELEDAMNFIDTNHFEELMNAVEKKLQPLKGPDLSNEPLLSFRSYMNLVYKLHPSLQDDYEFNEFIKFLGTRYHTMIKNYVEQNGSWMFDSLIELFMKTVDMNIILISDETKLPITHIRPYSSKYTMFIYHIHNHFESIGLYQHEIMKRVFEDRICFP